VPFHEIKTNDVGFLLKTVLKFGTDLISVGNVHGTSTPGNKFDSDVRLKQSEVIIDSFEKDNRKIIIGDFNLLRDTKSIQMFENAGYRNLVKDF
jgi:predicted extracellular nuclease